MNIQMRVIPHILWAVATTIQLIYAKHICVRPSGIDRVKIHSKTAVGTLRNIYSNTSDGSFTLIISTFGV